MEYSKVSSNSVMTAKIRSIDTDLIIPNIVNILNNEL